MTYLTVTKEQDNFRDVFKYCADNVIPENLKENGGTLMFKRVVFQSDTVIIACDNEDIVAFNALRTRPEGLYINQIAVKNSHKRQGIGTELVELAKDYAKAKEMSVYCHVREYNVASQEMFKSCGFIKNDSLSTEDNFFYCYEELKKETNR